MNKFPLYIDPIVINGKMFERYDVPGRVDAVVKQLCRASELPKEAKRSAAAFITAASKEGLANVKPSLLAYCNSLLR